MIRPRFLTLLGIVAAAAALRLLPHWPNFTPIAAMALFGGAHFSSRRAAFAVPLAAMLLSDAVLGFHAMMPFVYAAFVGAVGLGLLLRTRRTPLAIGAAALAASVGFFVVTNAAVWAVGGLYPHTAAGLLAALAAGLPFYAPTLAGDAFYTALLFGGFALAQRALPALREDAAPAAVPAAG
ncbi:MAG TPA: DUF6580 family putative transport protein [bacterium]|nr:DUF6580 family putative transport protein [bacterium]